MVFRVSGDLPAGLAGFLSVAARRIEGERKTTAEQWITSLQLSWGNREGRGNASPKRQGLQWGQTPPAICLGADLDLALVLPQPAGERLRVLPCPQAAHLPARLQRFPRFAMGVVTRPGTELSPHCLFLGLQPFEGQGEHLGTWALFSACFWARINEQSYSRALLQAGQGARCQL